MMLSGLHHARGVGDIFRIFYWDAWNCRYRMNLGKLQYFTNLNSSATKGDDSPIETIIYGFWSQWDRDQIYPEPLLSDINPQRSLFSSYKSSKITMFPDEFWNDLPSNYIYIHCFPVSAPWTKTKIVGFIKTVETVKQNHHVQLIIMYTYVLLYITISQ